MPAERPDTITVTATQKTEVRATSADLTVVVRGSSLVSGNEALKKAREVSQLVGELLAYGLTAHDVAVQGVQAEVSSGFLGKSSSATYTLRVRCSSLESLPDLLGVVTSQKTAALRGIEWRYGDADAVRDGATAACIVRAGERARRIAAGLGVRVLGVHAYMERYVDNESGYVGFPMQAQSRAQGPTRARISTEDLPFEISHAKTVEAHVEVQYRVSAFEESERNEPGGSRRGAE